MKCHAGIRQSQISKHDSLQEFVVTLHKKAPVDIPRVRPAKFSVRWIVGFFRTACAMNSPSPKRPVKWPHGSGINMEAMMRISVRGDDSVIEHSVNLCEKLRLDFFWRDLPKHESSTHLCRSEKIAVLIHQRGDRTRGKNRSSLTQIQVIPTSSFGTLGSCRTAYSVAG